MTCEEHLSMIELELQIEVVEEAIQDNVGHAYPSEWLGVNLSK